MSPLRRGMPVITGIGLATSLGGNTAQSCAALRAGLLRFQRTDDFFCVGNAETEGALEAALVSPVAGIDPAVRGVERLLALTLPALSEALEETRLSRSQLRGISLHLSLPQRSRPGLAELEASFPVELCQRSGLGQLSGPGKLASLTISRAGHSGFGEACQSAVDVLTSEGSEIALVVCVDSLLDPSTLQWLDRAGRLKCSRSPEGVIAGEAAAVMVMQRATDSLIKDGRIRGTIDAIGQATEPATLSSDLACTGVGLSTAFKSAASRLPAPPSPPWVVTDLNGERYRGLEWGYVVSRLHELLGGLRATWYLADCVGDVGAAVGGLAAARVLHAFDRQYAPASQACTIMSSDEGARGVVVLGSPERGQN